MKITLTGADEQTDLDGLVELSERLGVEIGILFSMTPEDRPRYPRMRWICEALLQLRTQCALHVCGRDARKLVLARPFPGLQGRLQINGRLRPWEVQTALSLYGNLTTQHDDRELPVFRTGRRLLVDGSGGRWFLPKRWSRPEWAGPVGFAGGLSPWNLPVELPRIAAVAKGDWWIDMETSLREEDLFSLDQAHSAVDAFEKWKAANGR